MEKKKRSFLEWVKFLVVNEQCVEKVRKKKGDEEMRSTLKVKIGEKQPLLKEEGGKEMSLGEDKSGLKEEIMLNLEEESNLRIKKYTKYSLLFITLYSSYRFVFNMMNLFINQVMIPKDVSSFAGEELKNTINSNVQAVLAAVNVLGPIVGFVSDRTKKYTLCGIDIGRRKPYIFLGMFFWFVTFMIRPFLVVDEEYPGFYFYAYCTVVVAGSLCSLFALTTYNALFPDLFHPSQKFLAAAINGVTANIGETVGKSVFGAFWGIIPTWLICLIMTIVGVVGTLPIFLFREGSSGDPNISFFSFVSFSSATSTKVSGKRKKKKKRKKGSCKGCFQNLMRYIYSFITPFLHWNFLMCFLSRFICQLGIGTIDSNFLFFLQDCVKDYTFFGMELAQTDTEAQAVIQWVKFGAGLVTAFAFPVLSKFLTKRLMIFVGSSLIVVSFFFYITSQDFTVIIFFSVLHGAGFSGFISIYFPLIASCLPSMKDFAKDMSIFSLAAIIPSACLLPVMGLVVKWGNDLSTDGVIQVDNFGYYLIFFISIASIMVGSLALALLIPKEEERIFRKKGKK